MPRRDAASGEFPGQVGADGWRRLLRLTAPIERTRIAIGTSLSPPGRFRPFRIFPMETDHGSFIAHQVKVFAPFAVDRQPDGTVGVCRGTGELYGYGFEYANGGTGSINVSITDPPSCKFPNGDFQHVYVTIRSVQAHTSSTAGDNSPGWQELAPQLNKQPMQIDLFAAGPNACLLTMLGSNTALPTGTYQQIRLLLVPNDGSRWPCPGNQCMRRSRL